MRTRASHNRHCRLVENDQTLSSTYGVKRASILSQSRYFHVVDGLDLNVMHDQLEGVLPLQIKLLLQKYITGKRSFFFLIGNHKLQFAVRRLQSQVSWVLNFNAKLRRGCFSSREIAPLLLPKTYYLS